MQTMPGYWYLFFADAFIWKFGYPLWMKLLICTATALTVCIGAGLIHNDQVRSIFRGFPGRWMILMIFTGAAHFLRLHDPALPKVLLLAEPGGFIAVGAGLIGGFWQCYKSSAFRREC